MNDSQHPQQITISAHVDRQVATAVDSESLSSALPNEALLCEWVNRTLSHPAVQDNNVRKQPALAQAEISIRLVDREESQALNRDYRQKDKPTNVLSFPADLPEIVDLPLLGDLIICASVVEQEAKEQDKASTAHWAHMVIHGTLHLLGYDHIDNHEAEAMEALETDILATLGIACPYHSSHH